MKIKVTQAVTTEVDTDSFTKEQWIEFIKEYVPVAVIKRIMETDLFPFSALQIKAVNAYNLCQELNNEWFD